MQPERLGCAIQVLVLIRVPNCCGHLVEGQRHSLYLIGCAESLS